MNFSKLSNGPVLSERPALAGLEQLAAFISECGDSGGDIRELFARIGDLMFQYVSALNLDAEIPNLVRFGVCVAIEMSPFLKER